MLRALLRRTVPGLLIAGIVAGGIVTTAGPADAAGWTTVRSVASSTSPVKVTFRDGGWDHLTAGESSHYYRAEPRTLSRPLDVCVKVSRNGGDWKRLTARSLELKDGSQYRVKAWQNTAC